MIKSMIYDKVREKTSFVWVAKIDTLKTINKLTVEKSFVFENTILYNALMVKITKSL